MSARDVDDYLAGLDEPKRATLSELRATIAAILPDAEQGLSYGVPVFRVDGTPVAGFSAAKHHVSFLPHSGDVIAGLDPGELEGFEASKGAVRMPVDRALPERLVRSLIAARRAEAGV